MAIFQPFAFRAEQAGGGLPPVGSYITDNLEYYFDFGEPTSYSGTGTTITNIAPSGTKRGDAVIYAGTRDSGTQTTSGTTYSAERGTLKLGGSGGAWDQYTTDQNWFGDITNPTTDSWQSDVTAEFGFYWYNHNWTGLIEYGPNTSQRNAGPGVELSSTHVVLFGIAGYNYPTSPNSTNNTWTVGQAYIVHNVISGTTAKRYINGVFYDQVSINGTRRDANGSPHVWGCLYTQESGLDRLADPNWGEYQYVRFYQGKALSDAEVLQNYNANKARLGLS